MPWLLPAALLLLQAQAQAQAQAPLAALVGTAAQRGCRGC